MKPFRYALRDFIAQSIQNNYGLAIFTLLAFFIANSKWASFYLALQNQWHFEVNEIGMSLFFFLIGMELKRECLVGELKTTQARLLPACAAIGGMLIPALIFLILNISNPKAHHAAAIPMATDIAFALGALQLLGKRIRPAEKIFLLSVAVFDDLGAILIIALFYTKTLVPSFFLLSLLSLFFFILFRKKNLSLFFYFLNGALLWFSFFKAGIHPTLAGVITGLALPFQTPDNQIRFFQLEKKCHSLVSLLILPAFAFLNAGLAWPSLSTLHSQLELISGITLGLLFGKPIGILGAVFISLLAFKQNLPKNLSWGKLLGLSCLAGIGFTMSLFISILSFEFDPIQLNAARLAILIGSLFSALIGILCLIIAHQKEEKNLTHPRNTL